MTRREMTDRAAAPRASLFWSAAGGMFLFGIVLAILGALFGLPEFRGRLDITMAQQGDIFLSLFSGVFLSTMITGPALDSFGSRFVLTLSAALVTIGLVAFAFATSYLAAVGAAFLLGFGGGGLNTATNALVSDVYAENRAAMLNLLGAFFGFGGLFIPFLAAIVLGTIGPVLLLWLAAALSVLCVAAYTVIRFPLTHSQSKFSPLAVLRAARHPGVLLIAAMLFFQSGNESSIGGWTSTYLGASGASPRAATWGLAGYWAALVAGRALSGTLFRSIRKPAIVLGSALGSIAGALVLLLSPSAPLMAGGAALLGLSYAAIYPTTLAIAADRNPQETGTLFSLLFSVGLLGGMAFPWALGRASQGWGIRVGMTLPLAGATAITVLILVISGSEALRAKRAS